VKAVVLLRSIVGDSAAVRHPVAKGMRPGDPVEICGSPSGTVAWRTDLVVLGALPQISRMPTLASGRDAAQQGEAGVPIAGELDGARRWREPPPRHAVRGPGAAA
jgi:hypothetical protein